MGWLDHARSARGPSRTGGVRRAKHLPRNVRPVLEPMEPRRLLDGTPTFQRGDVVLGGSGFIEWHRADGTLVKTLDTSVAPNTEHEGLAFDAAGNLYAGNFDDHTISRYDRGGNYTGQFGSASSFSTDLESLLFNAAGHLFVGTPDGDRKVRELDAAGNLLKTYAPAPEGRGSDWLDIAPDQQTLYYTSEGTSVKTFNLATNTQGPDFATNLPGSHAFQLRLLADGGVIVADEQSVLHLAPDGSILKEYTIPKENNLFAVNLDPDGKSFWTAGYDTNTVYHFDIATGAVLGKFSVQASTGIVGIVVVGQLTEATVADLSISATNPATSGTVGQSLTLSFQVMNLGPNSNAGTVATITLPPSVSLTGWGSSQGVMSAQGGTVTANLGALANHASATITLAVMPNQAGPMSVAAQVGGVDDTNLSNNSANISLTIKPASPPPPVVVDGPRVVALKRVDIGGKTAIVVGFNSALLATRAQSLGNYTLFLVVRNRVRQIALQGAKYDPILHIVTLTTLRRLDPRSTYALVINGSSPTGVSDPKGILLDGAGNGKPGSSYVAFVPPPTR